MLDAGVHLSHKHTLLMKKHSRFKNSTTYSTESASALTNGEETTDSIISKMLLNLSCLVSDRSSAMKQEKKNLKKIFLLSVYKEIRTVFPFCRKIW